ncbi:hypothetical protein G9A89_010436 [Geosiphon pyriformis]|nr:hypothetical protein G9A89_010436 [Geosiphon pyriformis]
MTQEEDYLLSNGASFCFNDDESDCVLEVVDKNDSPGAVSRYSEKYSCHQIYLSLKSKCLKDLIKKYHDQLPHQYLLNKYKNDKNMLVKMHIKVKLFAPELTKFEEILFWMYTGDNHSWYANGFSPENYHIVVKNIQILGLGDEALKVCHRFRDSYTNFLRNDHSHLEWIPSEKEDD